MSDLGVAILFIFIMGACIFALAIRLGESLAEIDYCRSELRLLQNANDSLKAARDECTANNVGMANKLLAANAEIEGLKAERDQLTNDCTKLHSQLNLASDMLQQAKQDCLDLRATMNDYADELHECRDKLNAKTEECRSLTSRLDQSVRERGDVVAANTKLHAELQRMREAVLETDKASNKLSESLDHYINLSDDLQKRLSDTQTLKNQTQEMLDSYAAMSDELTSQVAGLQDECSRLGGLVGQRNASLIDCKLHIGKLAAVLQEWHVDYEDQVSATIEADLAAGEATPEEQADAAKARIGEWCNDLARFVTRFNAPLEEAK